MKFHVQISAHACRKQGLWDEFLARMDECDGRVALQTWWASDAALALVGQMPDAWRELAEEELDRRCGAR